jgi:subtilisin
MALTLVVALAAPVGAAPTKVPVIIGFAGPPGPADEALVRGAGGDIKHTYHLVPAIAASVPQAAIDGLRHNPRVVRVEPDIQVHAIDQALPWGVDRVDAEVVRAAGNAGSGVKVAVLDTGIDLEHPDLAVAGGASFAKGKSYDDKNGHGTHVAGTVAALDNDIGVVGVAPAVSLYAVKVLGNGGTGSYSDVIAGLQWAVDNGMQVTNNSYGSSGDPGQTVKDAFDAAYAAGLLNVAAAGNESGGDVIYPAKYDSVIAVSATTDTDALAGFSSIGPEVELAAPGKSIYSTYKDGGYATMSGTSMASPHVAGVAALVYISAIQRDLDGDGTVDKNYDLDGDGLWDANEVRAALADTAEDIGLPATQQGNGLVDAENAALGTTGGNNLPAPAPPNDPPAVTITSPADGSAFDSGATILFEGTAGDTEDGDLTASLVWTSDIDGQIGTGGSFSTTLSDGNHTITAAVTDSGGATGSASISITVGTPTTATKVIVDSVTYTTQGGRNGDKHLNVTVALVDDLGNPVGGASVSITLSHDSGSSWSGAGTTGTDGTVTFSLKNAPSGCYTTTVDNVTAGGLSWDGVTPTNGFCK